MGLQGPGALRFFLKGQLVARVLDAGVDFCAAPRHTADVAALVTAFCWVVMVMAYVVYYVHHNREDARRRVEYRKSLPRECDGASSVL